MKGIRLRRQSRDLPDCYPFSLPVLRQLGALSFTVPVTFFVGENGSGKSTLLEAMARAAGLHIWQTDDRPRLENNPHQTALHRQIAVDWQAGRVPGSFFCGERFQDFAKLLDEWARLDPGQLRYFGGRSLRSLSHGQSLMTFFRARYQRRGLYLLDEPETALSPSSQVELVRLLHEMGTAGHAQFVVATHSPILLACPHAQIYAFEGSIIRTIHFEECEHVRIYREFLAAPERYLEAKPSSRS